MRIFYIVFLMLFALYANAQDTLEKAPKQKSFEFGYRYIPSASFDKLPISGYTLLFDYAWKLSGFHKKKPVYLSVPLGYTYFMAGNDSLKSDARILSYGWTIRHELTRGKVVHFIGYALLLNQLSFTGTEGQVFGHQTKFDYGINFKRGDKKLYPFIKLEYSYTRYPSLGLKNSNSIHSVEFKAGIRF